MKLTRPPPRELTPHRELCDIGYPPAERPTSPSTRRSPSFFVKRSIPSEALAKRPERRIPRLPASKANSILDRRGPPYAAKDRPTPAEPIFSCKPSSDQTRSLLPDGRSLCRFLRPTSLRTCKHGGALQPVFVYSHEISLSGDKHFYLRILQKSWPKPRRLPSPRAQSLTGLPFRQANHQPLLLPRDNSPRKRKDCAAADPQGRAEVAQACFSLASLLPSPTTASNSRSPSLGIGL